MSDFTPGIAVSNATVGVDEATQINALLQSLRDAGLIQTRVLVTELGDTMRTERGYRLSLGAPVDDFMLGPDRNPITTASGERIKVV